jgi:hypothetical protein
VDRVNLVNALMAASWAIAATGSSLEWRELSFAKTPEQLNVVHVTCYTISSYVISNALLILAWCAKIQSSGFQRNATLLHTDRLMSGPSVSAS